MDEPWGQDAEAGKIPQALKGLEEDHTTEHRHRRLCRAMDERQVVRGGRVQCFQLYVTEVRTDTGIRRLMHGGHDRTSDGGVPKVYRVHAAFQSVTEAQKPYNSIQKLTRELLTRGMGSRTLSKTRLPCNEELTMTPRCAIEAGHHPSFQVIDKTDF
jgi:hypothetical protein